MKLSVVICVYNTPREYFEACLDSITDSTLQKGGFCESAEYEICVVDDGSAVDYSDLVEKYKLSYKKTENRGIFCARLAGIAMARGEYIAFVDSDDTVSWNYHRPMLQLASREGLDIVINDWAFHTERIRYCCRNDATIRGDLSLKGGEALRAFLSQSGLQHSFYVLWNKLYRTELLRRAAEELSELATGEEMFNFSEDALMNFYAFLYAKSVKNIHTGYYFYRIHSSQTVAVTDADKLKRQIDCMAYTLDRMESEVRGLDNSSELLGYIAAWRELMARSHYSHARGAGFESLYPYIKEKYRVARLRKAKYSDGKYYTASLLLPENIRKMDAALLAAYRSGSVARFVTDHGSEYIKAQLRGLASLGCEVRIDGTGAVIPKPKVLVKNKVIMNSLVRRVGMILFPKGSKIRAILKKKI